MSKTRPPTTMLSTRYHRPSLSSRTKPTASWCTMNDVYDGSWARSEIAGHQLTFFFQNLIIFFWVTLILKIIFLIIKINCFSGWRKQHFGWKCFTAGHQTKDACLQFSEHAHGLWTWERELEKYASYVQASDAILAEISFRSPPKKINFFCQKTYL